MIHGSPFRLPPGGVRRTWWPPLRRGYLWPPWDLPKIFLIKVETALQGKLFLNLYFLLFFILIFVLVHCKSGGRILRIWIAIWLFSLERVTIFELALNLNRFLVDQLCCINLKNSASGYTWSLINDLIKLLQFKGYNWSKVLYHYLLIL